MNERFGLGFAGKTAVQRALHERLPCKVVPDPERSVRFEQAEHVFIEGDNLAALGLMTGPYFGRVHAIYIDPPYNTGHDFVYRDRFAETHDAFLRRTEQVDDAGNPLVSNPQGAGRFHSAWLGMMYPRLWLARQLLRDDGLCFVSIDDHEVHRLRLLMDEIFGEDCFVAQIVVVSNRGGRDYLRIATGHEYVLCYGGSPQAPVRELPKQGPALPFRDAGGAFELRELRNRNPKFHPGNRPNLAYPVWIDPKRTDAQGCCAVACEPLPGYDVCVEPRNSAGQGSVWRWGRPRLCAAIALDDPEASGVVARRKRDGGYNIYEKHRKTTTRPRSIWDDTALRSEQGTIDLRRVLGDAVFDHPKPVALVRRCLQLTTDPDGVVLDFFAGSGTTGQAVIEQNQADGGHRRFIGVQWPESTPPDSPAAAAGYATVSDIAHARLQRVLGRGHAAGLRWFRLGPSERPAWTTPRTPLPGREYLESMRAHEKARAAVHVGTWEMALDCGVPLDARLTQLGEGLLRCTDPRTDRTVVIAPRAVQTAGALERLDVAPGTTVACDASLLDDAALNDLGQRYDLRLF